MAHFKRNFKGQNVVAISYTAFNPDIVYYMRCILRFKNIERLNIVPFNTFYYYLIKKISQKINTTMVVLMIR